MKTLQAIVMEHIARSAAMVHDPQLMQADSQKVIARMQARMGDGPSER